ncbi:hydrogenase maturation nickel metallochaperone HypA/HybF [Paradesulfitobacterium ferrireducens]|uniref:hydrogenase maturation nickel metallochaperone HypA/HybF n=1 Tax=Paradesulfitobacterium ferrireducens TaxID=2816476 RepID=UPI001A8C4D7E|nr:hydrogenase maturation nickel metallochaperone HypA [Paradesulfitobacterium ferrireducens]
MHEMSLMAEMIELLGCSARENNIDKIIKVHLVVGKMTMALPDALTMAFDVFKTEDIFAPSAELTIEQRETIAKCRTCGSTFSAPDNYLFICPTCQGLRIEIISGRELYIASFEGEEA